MAFVVGGVVVAEFGVVCTLDNLQNRFDLNSLDQCWAMRDCSYSC